MIGDPPSVPAVKATVSEASAAVTDETVGAAGTDAGHIAVITWLLMPVEETATNVSCPVGPPQVTDLQLLLFAEVRVVQVVPSVLVITRLPLPLEETATKSPPP